MNYKKFISAVSAVLFSANLIASAVSSAIAVNNSKDAATLSRIRMMRDYLLGETAITKEQYDAADMNSDGTVDVFDFILMEQAFLDKNMQLEYTAETEHYSVGYRENIYKISPSDNAVIVTSLQELAGYLSCFFVDDIVRVYIQKYNGSFFEDNVLLLDAFWYAYTGNSAVNVQSVDCRNNFLNVSVNLKQPVIDEETAFEMQAMLTQIVIKKSEYVGLPLNMTFSSEQLPPAEPSTQPPVQPPTEPPVQNDNKKVLDVQNILQNPELPTGCEVTSLAMLLNYLGYPADKLTIARNYLPKLDFYWEDGIYHGADFRTTFAGNPESEYSYGCYAPCIVTTANSYFLENGFDAAACNITGADFDSLLDDYIDNDKPVLIWITSSNLHESELTAIWTTPDGEELQWRSYEHCAVLAGYDKENQLIYTSDPMYGDTAYDYSTIRQRYNEMGQQAVYIVVK